MPTPCRTTHSLSGCSRSDAMTLAGRMAGLCLKGGELFPLPLARCLSWHMSRALCSNELFVFFLVFLVFFFVFVFAQCCYLSSQYIFATPNLSSRHLTFLQTIPSRGAWPARAKHRRHGSRSGSHRPNSCRKVHVVPECTIFQTSTVSCHKKSIIVMPVSASWK